MRFIAMITPVLLAKVITEGEGEDGLFASARSVRAQCKVGIVNELRHRGQQAGTRTIHAHVGDPWGRTDNARGRDRGRPEGLSQKCPTVFLAKG